jgi:hypothetical protein
MNTNTTHGYVQAMRLAGRGGRPASKPVLRNPRAALATLLGLHEVSLALLACLTCRKCSTLLVPSIPGRMRCQKGHGAGSRWTIQCRMLACVGFVPNANLGARVALCTDAAFDAALRFRRQFGVMPAVMLDRLGEEFGQEHMDGQDQQDASENHGDDHEEQQDDESDE